LSLSNVKCKVTLNYFFTDSLSNRNGKKGENRVRKPHKGDRNDVCQGKGKKIQFVGIDERMKGALGEYREIN